jgi:hypothetical protein
MPAITDLKRRADEAWKRVYGLANLYEDKGSTLKPDGTYPSFEELEPLRNLMLEAEQIATDLDRQVATEQHRAFMLEFCQPDRHLEAALEDRISGSGE